MMYRGCTLSSVVRRSGMIPSCITPPNVLLRHFHGVRKGISTTTPTQCKPRLFGTLNAMGELLRHETTSSSLGKNAIRMPPSPSALGKDVINNNSQSPSCLRKNAVKMHYMMGNNTPIMPSSPSALGIYGVDGMSSSSSSALRKPSTKKTSLGRNAKKMSSSASSSSSSVPLSSSSGRYDKGNIYSPELFHDFDTRINFTSLYAILAFPFIATVLAIVAYMKLMVNEKNVVKTKPEKKARSAKEGHKSPAFHLPVVQKGGQNN